MEKAAEKIVESEQLRIDHNWGNMRQQDF